MILVSNAISDVRSILGIIDLGCCLVTFLIVRGARFMRAHSMRAHVLFRLSKHMRGAKENKLINHTLAPLVCLKRLLRAV